MRRQDVRLDYSGSVWDLYVRRRTEQPTERWEPVGSTNSPRTALRVWRGLLAAEQRK